MRIQHNITALNAANRLKANENTVAKNIQKLSSGYRINSAADDAAGLAVSEKMREQISGLTQAEDNTKNGISLVQTAEGGLNETSAILQRMNTLATESANGTYKNEDRGNLQLEVTHLKTEIDRIANSTKFNEISLLDGSLSATGSASISSDLNLTSTTPAVAAKSVVNTWDTSKLAADGNSITYTVAYKDAGGNATSTKVTLTLAIDSDTKKGKITYESGKTIDTTGTNGVSTAQDIGNAVQKALADTAGFKGVAGTDDFSVAVDAGSGDVTITTLAAGLNKATVTGVSSTEDTKVKATATPGSDGVYSLAGGKAVFDASSPANAATSAKSAVFDVNGKRFAFAAAGTQPDDIKKYLGADVNVVTLKSGSNISDDDLSNMATAIQAKTGLTATATNAGITLAAPAGKALVFQVGAENSDDQRAQLNIDNMNSNSLGLKDLDISSQDGANAAIDIIKSAIATVSTTRAQLGGLQNELEHTANNLGTMNENLTSAESTIRDVDMTDEYVQYSKNQILSQAANAMLAQANTQPQNVLSLLKG